jgi:hypothetical protein
VRVLVSACIMVVDSAITTWIEGGQREALDAMLAEGADHVRRGFAPDRTAPSRGAG